MVRIHWPRPYILPVFIELRRLPQVVPARMSAAYWEEDWKWAQEQLLRFSCHEDPQVQWTVASGLGLIAAFHGQIDLDLVEPILLKLKASAIPSVAEAASNSIDEILCGSSYFPAQNRRF